MTQHFLHRFLDLAHADPERPLLHFYGAATQVTSYGAKSLATAGAARAGWLATFARPGDLVFIISHNPFEQVIWWLGSLFMGGVPGILTPPTPKLDKTQYYGDLSKILAAYPAAHVVYDKDVFDPGASLDARCHGIEGLALAFGEIPQADAIPGGKTLIFQQSSGTTGLRKGVLLSARAVAEHMEHYGRFLGIGETDVILNWLPLYHDMGLVACLMQAVYWAIPLVLTSPFVWLSDAAWLGRAATAHRATLCWLPNFAFKYLADRIKTSALPPTAFATLRLVINCSEPVHSSSLEILRSTLSAVGLRADAVSTCYAMAENTFAVTQTPPGKAVSIEIIDHEILERDGRAVMKAGGRAVAASGEAVPDVEIQIRCDGARGDDGVAGEICIRSSYLMQGYLGVGERADAITADGWFQTGDLGYLRAGALFVIGRRKDLIIRAGRNIDPAYLETSLVEVPGLKPGRWVAFGIDNAAEGTEDIVILAESDQDPAEHRTIKNAIVKVCNRLAGIPPQKIEILPLNWLIKSSSGKISRTNCRKKYLESYARRD